MANRCSQVPGARAALSLLIACVLAPTPFARQFGPAQLVDPGGQGADSAYAADLDGDGDRDLVSATSATDGVAWFQNLDALGSFGPPLGVTSSMDYPVQVHAADLDGDADADLLVASLYDSSIAWFENSDGQGTFGPRQLITTTAFAIRHLHTADLDGDGDPDLLAAYGLDVAWFENTDGLGSFGPAKLIANMSFFASSAFAADLDGDGDQDALAAMGYGGLGVDVAWCENLDGLGSFGPQQTITSAAQDTRSVHAADMDGDGDADVLAAANDTDMIAWYENSDGLGAFGPAHFIQHFGSSTSGGSGYSGIRAADLDGDGDQDVLSGSLGKIPLAGGYNPGGVEWHENSDGSGAFPYGTTHGIGSAGGVSALCAADLDGDGLPDVISAQLGMTSIAWHENLHVPKAALEGDVQMVSLASGGQQQFTLTAGIENAQRIYLLLGSVSGTSPGLLLDGLVLPLNPDSYFLYTLAAPNTPTHMNSLGVLSGYGSGSAALVLPPGLNPSLVGSFLNHAYAVFDTASVPGTVRVGFVSNAVPLLLWL